jgi:Skp family chaperone for outer membrane proteins
VKRTLVIALGVATLGTGIYLGSRALGQPQYNSSAMPAAQPVAPPQTKVALVNIDLVMKSYQKVNAYREEYKRKFQFYDTQLKDMKTQLEKLQQRAQQTALSPTEREQVEKDAKQVQRAAQDKQDEAKAAVMKFEADMETQLYREIEQMVQYYARSRGIELVLSYRDVTDPAEAYNPANVQRKIMMGPCMPIYHHPGMDISQDIVLALNGQYMRSQGAGAPAGR